MMKTIFCATGRFTSICLCAISVVGVTHGVAQAQTAEQAPATALPQAATELQRELNDFDLDAAWVYNDWEAARDQAAREGKPIFALFR